MTLTFSIMINGQEIIVRCQPDYFVSLQVAHIEFLSPYEPRRRIPVSETGYKSHFSFLTEIEAAPSVEEYALALARAMINADRKRGDDDDNNQLFLF